MVTPACLRRGLAWDAEGGDPTCPPKAERKEANERRRFAGKGGKSRKQKKDGRGWAVYTSWRDRRCCASVHSRLGLHNAEAARPMEARPRRHPPRSAAPAGHISQSLGPGSQLILLCRQLLPSTLWRGFHHRTQRRRNLRAGVRLLQDTPILRERTSSAPPRR